jgi:hypothetical protein
MDSNTTVKQSGTDQKSAAVSESQKQLWEKNIYYRDGFRNVLWIANIQIVLILLLVLSFSFYVKTAKKHDGFFAETIEGRQMQMEGLDLPNMGKIALTNWVEQAATQIMTFGFNDIDQRFALSRLNFSEEGWQSFHKAMSESGLIDSVVKTQQIVTAVPQSPPVIIQEGLIRGKYRWVFEMQMLVTFRSGGVKQASTKTVRVVLEQVPTRDNPNGIGIGEWYIY